MLYKFAAGTAVASCLIVLGVVAILGLRLFADQNYYQLTAIWCLIPFMWGMWMMLAPRSWMERRLPAWGAILGAIVAINGIYVLNIPEKFAGLFIPPAWKPGAVLLAAAIYGALWIVVDRVYRALIRTTASRRTSAAA